MNENECAHTHHSSAFCNGIIRDRTEQHVETGCGRTPEPEAPVTRENRRAVSCYRGLSWKTFQPHKLLGKCECSEVCKVLQRTSRFWGRRVVPSATLWHCFKYTVQLQILSSHEVYFCCAKREKNAPGTSVRTICRMLDDISSKPRQGLSSWTSVFN